MAQISYRANLSSAIFPMTLARSGRSVIIPGPDQNFDRRVDPQGEQKTAGIPQAIYMENVIPTADGYQSVGYRTAQTLPEIDMIPLEIKMPGSVVPEILLFSRTLGLVYRYNLGVWNFVAFSGVYGGPPTSENSLSYAVVRGVVYIFNEATKSLYTYVVGTLTNVTATVLPVGFLPNIISIAGSYNYLVALDNAASPTIYWSSTTTPTDFTASLVTGAGSGAATNIQGAAKFLRASPTGFFLYTTNNIVAATYTGNARYPFRFIPVKDSVGVINTWEVYSDVDESSQMMITRASFIAAVSQDVSQQLAAELTEYLERNNTYDIFNSGTNTFTVGSVASQQETARIYVFNSRYIVVSLQQASPAFTGIYDVAFVFDSLLQRYGKLKIRHTQVVTVPESFTTKLRLGFIDTFNRVIYRWYLDVNDNATDPGEIPMAGVLVLGKFQYVRSRNICLDQISTESGQPLATFPVPNFQLLTIPTWDGKTFLTAQTPWLDTSQSTGTVMTYNSSCEGKNVSLLIKGAFDLSSVEMMFHLGGDN